MTWLREQLDPERLKVLHGSLPPELEEQARWLRQQLAEIHKRYRAEAEPYIKRLAELEALRPPKFIYIPKEKP